MAGPLDSASAITKLPAQDLDRARQFYRDRLGLEAVEEREGGLRYVCGTTEFHLFLSSGTASGPQRRSASRLMTWTGSWPGYARADCASSRSMSPASRSTVTS